MHKTHSPVTGAEGPARPLSDALTSDGTERPVISYRARRFDHDDRTAADLEREATRLLREAGDLAAHNLAPAPYERQYRMIDRHGLLVRYVSGETVTPGMYHVDTVHKYTRQPQVAPDPVAFLGEARWEPRSVRYHGVTDKPVGPGAGMSVPEESRIVSIDDRDYELQSFRTDAVGRGYSFIGHRTVRNVNTTGRDYAAERSGTRSPGKPRADVMAMSDKTLANRWTTATQDQKDHAQSLAATLRNDGTITYRGMTVELVLVPSERVALVADDETRATFTLASFARRVALDV